MNFCNSLSVACVDVQAGEVWTEVMSELQVENVRPVTPDREALEAISMAINIRAEQVIQVQQELLDAQKQQDLMEEQEFYAQVSCADSVFSSGSKWTIYTASPPLNSL